jgi:hypothetical protein
MNKPQHVAKRYAHAWYQVEPSSVQVQVRVALRALRFVRTARRSVLLTSEECLQRGLEVRIVMG